MKRWILFLVGAAWLNAAPAQAQYVWLNLSFKAVLDPTNGTRAYPFTQNDLDDSITRMNATLASHQRGYRVRRVDPLLDIGGPAQGGTNGPSKWFWPNPRDLYSTNPDVRNQEQMDIEARNAPLAYRWNSNAVNYYVIAGLGVAQPAGESSYASSGHQIITLGTVHHDLVILHETGHWFELHHTQGGCNSNRTTGMCGNPTNCPIVKNGFRLGDDGIEDTLPVQAGDFCFTNQDLVALANFAIPYAACSPEQAQQVDDVFFNLMAYGFNRTMDRLTPKQLDKWTDYANNERVFALSGRMRFVSPTGNDGNTGLRAARPKRTVLDAVHASSAGGGDTVLLRPGNYNETITIFRRVTLRAAPTNAFAAHPRWATIGQP